MSVAPDVVNKKRKKTEPKPQSQLNKCLNEKRRREQENIYIEELAELISASASDMSSLSVKPDKCAILQETVNQIRRIKQEPEQSDELQQSEVSSSRPTILANDIYGPLLLEALDGFLFVVNTDGKIEFVSENITAFLKYTQDEIVDKIIYTIIHPNDRARFSSNLLPMMSLGNGCNWTTESTGGISKSRSFHCRFLVKPTTVAAATSSNAPGMSMDEDKPSPMANNLSSTQYENMQVSAVFFPFARDVTENAELESESQNRVACVARRIPHTEKSTSSLGIEQFTTRLDITGKITAIDTSGISETYSQYLNKELADCSIQDICHPSDVPQVLQHIKDTTQSTNTTSVMYRLRVGPDHYVRAQTKSKHFHFNQTTSEQEFIMSTHSIIREKENSTMVVKVDNSPRPSQPSLTNSSTSVSVTSPSASINAAVSSLTSSYGPFSSLSPGTSSEYSINELMMDIFPTGGWSLEGNSLSRDSDSGPSPAPNVVCANSVPVTTSVNTTSSLRTVQPSSSSSAFSPCDITVVMSSANSSPATPGRVPTPYGRSSAYSPSQVLSGGKVSPSATKLEKSPSDTLNIEVPTSNSAKIDLGAFQGNSQTSQKLRTLLMQNSDEPHPGRLEKKRNSREDDIIILNRSTSAFENRPPIQRPVATVVGVPQVTPSQGNAILRELLNQDDDEVADVRRQLSNSTSRLSVLLSQSANKPDERRKRPGDNNMLRRLLNNTDDSSTTSNRSEDLIHHLLKSDMSDRSISIQNKRILTETLPNAQTDPSVVPKSVAVDTNLSPTEIFGLSQSVASTSKRKSIDEGGQPSFKKTNIGRQHTHLAGQNPMLASMLAQTPRTPPSVIPTSVADSIVSQLPQERLPKNLDKKLIHTPYTTATISVPTTTISQSTAQPPVQLSQSQTTGRIFLSSTNSPIQPDIVTSDARGHITQIPASISLQSVLTKSGYTPQQQQGLLNKILSGGVDGTMLLSRSLSVPSTSSQQQSGFAFQLQPTSAQDVVTATSTRGLRDVLSGSASLSDSALATVGIAQGNQSSDPGLDELLDQIYSLQEEMNVVTTAGEESDILKYFSDNVDAATLPSVLTQPSTPSPSVTISQDMIDEKIAIDAIQKQLMSYETVPLVAGNPTSSASHSPLQQQAPHTSNPTVQLQRRITAEVPLTSGIVYATLPQTSSSGQPPAYARVRLPLTVPAGTIINNGQQIINIAAMQRMGFQQSGPADYSEILKRTLLQKRQRMYLQQQQKRLLEQQQKQQMTMQTQQPMDVINSAQRTAVFAENISELLNNNVPPPNVTLQRSTNIPEPQLSPRYNASLIGQVPSPVGQPSTPSQLSPSQRANPQSPFSPLTQQPFPSPTPPPPPSNFPQARMSPHSLSTYQPTGTSSSQSPSPAAQPAASQSPHMQLSPQQQNSSTTQWAQQRPSVSPVSANLVQQNPLLNAQLSQQSFGTSQPKFTAQQRQQIAVRSLPSPSPLQNSGSTFSADSGGNFSPLSPVTVYSTQPQQQIAQSQPQQQQQRVQRTISGPGRIATTRTVQPQLNNEGSFAGVEPIRSPQPLASPNYSQATITNPVSSYNPTIVTAGGLTYNMAQDGLFFSFDQQNLHVIAAAASDRARAAKNLQVSSNYIRQELRAIVGARTQQSQSNQVQNVVQPSQSINTGATSLNNIPHLTRQTLEELGLSLERLPGDATVTVDGHQFPRALLSLTSEAESSSTQNCVPSPRVEEPKPADQKKSLLQQLLSEPT